MLRKETVSRPTLELLKTLMNDPMLARFFLVGGTALALHIGHRISIDLDLFSTETFDSEQLLEHLEMQYYYELDYRGNNTLKGSINGIKVDLISHRYPMADAILVTEEVRMASLKDIAAMKLNAISDNGTRLKDFVDIAFLSNSLNLFDMINAFQIKYASRNPTMLIKALDYHTDIDFTDSIELLNGNYNWGDIEQRLKFMTVKPQTLFTELPIRRH